MGRPFEREIEKVRNTLDWAMKLDVDDFQQQLLSTERPILVIGSGGSLSACHYAVSLIQEHGIVAKALTPLELHHSKNIIGKSTLLFISASGKNTDILFAYKLAVNNEPSKIISVCMQKDSPLSTLASKCPFSLHYEFDIPTGKDGFLATNSLIAFMGYLFIALSTEQNKSAQLSVTDNFLKRLNVFIDQVSPDFTFNVLYGGWGQPVAMDIESKLAEAALGDVLISDYRNFGHGRHHWFDKRKVNSAIISLITEKERELADKTLKLLPKDIPVLIIDSIELSSLATIDLLMKTFEFINALGKLQHIDPGRPGVPSFGSKLYKLSYAKTLAEQKEPLSEHVATAICRKAHVPAIKSLEEHEKQYWLNAYSKFRSKLANTTFGSIIFDYDGTLCSSVERYSGISNATAAELVTALEKGLIIGIATGRGKSVREDLANHIPKRFQKHVLIGYYNCGVIAPLHDIKSPNKLAQASTKLISIYKVITSYTFSRSITAELKPNQITIEIKNKIHWKKVKDAIIQLVAIQGLKGLEILESTHSMDIVDQYISSKLNMVSACQVIAKRQKRSEHCLCIGDKGQWPGNDYLLLSKQYSLSVDETSALADSCWNLCPTGIKNVPGTLYYLSNLCFGKNGATIQLP